jgi:CrcB protein
VIALMVAIGAAVGAPLRYLIDRGIQARYKPVFPWGTLLVNVTACLAIGLVTGTVTATSPPQVQALIGTGLAGALSTLSTFSYQTLRLAEEGMRTFAIVYVLVTLAAGLLAAAAGIALGHVAWGLTGGAKD